MKIILVCLLHIDELPPMMTVIKVLSKKHKIVYIGIDEPNEKYRRMFGDTIEFINATNKNISCWEISTSKIKRSMYWKIYTYKNYHIVNKIINDRYVEGDILWIHHEHTLMHIDKIKYPYYLTIYELHTDLFKVKSKLQKRIKNATKVIVPEYTRAAIVQAMVGLHDLPVIVHNKPYEYVGSETNMVNNPMTEFVKEAHRNGKMVLLYSGIFLRERKLDTFIEAVNRMNDKFTVVLIGRKSDYLDELLSAYPTINYLGYFNPPNHLSVIKESDVGILTYVADNHSINPVFCAPNKIWEYAKYGIPMICNDIPGLKYTIEYNGFGFCCNINSVDDICRKLTDIHNNYDELSMNAYKYYNTIDVEKEILSIVKKPTMD